MTIILNEKMYKTLVEKTMIISVIIIKFVMRTMRNMIMSAIIKGFFIIITIMIGIFVIKKIGKRFSSIENPTRELTEKNNKFFIVQREFSQQEIFQTMLGRYIIPDLYSKNEADKERVYKEKMKTNKQQNFIVETEMDVPETMWQQKIKFVKGDAKPKYIITNEGDKIWTVSFRDIKELIEKITININSKSPIKKK